MQQHVCRKSVHVFRGFEQHGFHTNFVHGLSDTSPCTRADLFSATFVPQELHSVSIALASRLLYMQEAGVQCRTSARNAQKDGNTTSKINGVFYFAGRQDVSVQRPERWKHHFLKTAGMFYCAERQEPRAPRKMETPLAEGVFYCAEREEPQAPSGMETPLAEDHWRVLLCRTT